jgi:hypothetical protein
MAGFAQRGLPAVRANAQNAIMHPAAPAIPAANALPNPPGPIAEAEPPRIQPAVPAAAAADEGLADIANHLDSIVEDNEREAAFRCN